jgi:hypothetical protein
MNGFWKDDGGTIWEFGHQIEFLTIEYYNHGNRIH